MGVVNDSTGRPALELTGGAAARLASLTPPGCEARVHLTMTDEYPLAQAQVMIEALPRDAATAPDGAAVAARGGTETDKK